MTKAYDVKDLLEKLQSKGLNVAEEAAKVLVEEVLAWVSESAALSENKIDDLVAVIVPVVKPYILKAVDSIDKVEG